MKNQITDLSWRNVLAFTCYTELVAYLMQSQ